MTTLSHGFFSRTTDKRLQTPLIAFSDSLADVETIERVDKKIAKGASFVVNPKRLLACYSNNENVLITIVVGSGGEQQTLTLTLSSWLALPFTEDDDAVVTFANPSNNPIDLDTVVSYLAV